MKSEQFKSETELLELATKILNNLKFKKDSPREDKWRTTEQLAYEMELFNADEIDYLNKILHKHHTCCLYRLKRGIPVHAMIRMAKYPDRTTLLPLWGSVLSHGPPWSELQPDQTDPPDDIPPKLHLPKTAPYIFLSHSHEDIQIALHLAEALAEMKISSWRYETHIDQRQNIAECVKKGIAKSACIVALLTRQSIASLWMLSELDTALKTGRPVVLIINAKDALLLKLLDSLEFPHPVEDYDLSVTYCMNVVHKLELDYRLRHNESHTKRYKEQVHNFLATLPSYLGNVPPGSEQRVWRPALAFPHLPNVWKGKGPVKLVSLGELPERLKV